VTSTSKNYVILFLSLTTLAGAGIAWQQYRLLSEWESRQPTVGPLLSAASRPAVPVAPSAVADTDAEIPVAPNDATEPDDMRPERPERGRDFAGNFAALMEDSEFAEAWRLQQMSNLDNRFAALFKQLNLSPTELARFKQLLIERQSSVMDVMAAARAEGINGRENREELRKLMQETQAEIDQSINALLGPQRYNQYQDYTATSPQRTLVDRVDTRLSYESATPLQPGQAEMLVRILADTGGPNGQITDQTLVRAQGVLDPGQLQILRDLQAEEQARRLVAEKMRSQRRPARPR
jgi:hypothetical protein